jgi:hypothetical protein
MIMEKKSKKYTELAGRVPPHSFSLVSEPPEQWGGKNGRQLLKMDDVEAIKLIQNTRSWPAVYPLTLSLSYQSHLSNEAEKMADNYLKWMMSKPLS